MPRRKTKINPESERVIGLRVRELRERMRYGQAEFAAAIGLSRAQLANVECGRTPLRYREALRIQDTFRQGLEWLGGTLPMLGSEDSYEWPGHEIVSTNQDYLFSEAKADVERSNRRKGDHAVSKFGGMSEDLFHRTCLGEMVYEAVSGALAEVAPGFVVPFIQAALEWIRSELGKCPKLPHELQAQVLDEIIAYKLREEADKTLRLTNSKANVEKQTEIAFDNVTEVGNFGAVKANLETLLARLKKATSERGKKTTLAKYMGVPLPNVSQWLSGEREPGGETTLRLLAWVTAEEAKQTKSPAGASTPAEPKAQVRESYEKKQNPSPP